MDIRQLLRYNDPYYKINREERNLSAILYHILLTGDNLQRFLKLIDCKFSIIESELALYFEYAFLRDLWTNIGYDKNQLKGKIILDLLKPTNHDELEQMSVQEFNSYFFNKRGNQSKCASVQYIQNPGGWSLEAFSEKIIDNDEFKRVCEFKWSFNAKPDLVIHTSNNKAVCIELKLESGEGTYPTSVNERRIFNDRGIPPVRQLSIQKKIMQQLLGIDSQFVVLAQKNISTGENNVWTWKEVFNQLDVSSCPDFLIQWLKRPQFIGHESES